MQRDRRRQACPIFCCMPSIRGTAVPQMGAIGMELCRRAGERAVARCRKGIPTPPLWNTRPSLDSPGADDLQDLQLPHAGRLRAIPLS